MEKIVELISNSNQIIFAVVSSENKLLGVVHFNDIKEIIFNQYRIKYTSIKEIMQQPADIIYPTDSMETVMIKFEKSKEQYLPVIKNGNYYGFVCKSIVLEAYRTKLKSMIIE